MKLRYRVILEPNENGGKSILKAAQISLEELQEAL